MEENGATQRLLEKMFEAAFKERFSQMARKYGQELVIQTWAQIVKGGGIKVYLSQWEWNSHMKIIDLLDHLDEYCDSVEVMIQKRAKRGKGKVKKDLSMNSLKQTEIT